MSQSSSTTLSAEDRQAIVRDVVQAVLTANSSTGGVLLSSSLPPVSMAAPTSSGVGPSQAANSGTFVTPLPSFASTFTLAPQAAVGAATTFSSSQQSAGSALFNVPSVLHQPFLVGPGCSPVPTKLVTQIISDKFVDMGELVSTNLVESENDPQVFLDGRIVLTSTPKRQRKKVEDIVTWVEAFGIYKLVLASYFPHRWADLSRYQLLILRTYRQFNGRAWLYYDKAFREHAAAAKLSDWSQINSQLYSFHTAGSVPRSQNPTLTDGFEPRGSINGEIICLSWNRGQCSARYGFCRFAHKCSSCSGHHRRRDCPSAKEREDHSLEAKRKASDSAGEYMKPAKRR